MAKYEVTKLVEAAKLNKRTGIPLVGPPTTIPYGAIISDVEEDGDDYKFSYMTERYQARRDTVAGAFHLLQGVAPSTAPMAPVPPPPSPAAVAAAPAPVADDRPLLDFQSLRVKGAGALSRARVPGGWLVSTAYAVTFVPDPQHEWDGGSVA
ncbi:MAG: hypothetical protein JNK87_33440 [Bryobacterales bacterium]|nr:hypothetical protein [Bryobacterales bacterium]